MKSWLMMFFSHKICTRPIGRLVSQFYSSLGCFYPSGTTGRVVSSNTETALKHETYLTRKTQPGTNWRVFWQSITLLSSSSKTPGKATGSVSDRTHVRSLARRKSKWTIGGCGALRRCGCARTYEGTQFLCVKFRLGSAGEPTICSHCYDVLNEVQVYLLSCACSRMAIHSTKLTSHACALVSTRTSQPCRWNASSSQTSTQRACRNDQLITGTNDHIWRWNSIELQEISYTI